MKTRENKSREKAKKGLFNSEFAGATVIAAVLLLCIIFGVLAVVRIEHVPEWKIDAEESHMMEVQSDMAELKSTVDLITLLTSDPYSSAYGFSITVPVSLGGGEVPVLESSKSSGTLSVNTEPCNITITTQKSTGSIKVLSPDQPLGCGGITYHSNNRQYIDQILRYENGAVILSQNNRSLMKQFPSFSIVSNQSNESNYTVSIHAINISGDSDTVSSDTDASLRLTGLNNTPIYDSNDSVGINSFSFTITTKYPDAWCSYFNEITEDAGLDRGDYKLSKNNTSNNGLYSVYFEFPSNNTSNKNLDRLYISESVIQAELGAGSNLRVNPTRRYGSVEDEGIGEEEPEIKRVHANNLLLNKNGIGGVISSGNYIQFKNNGETNDYWVEIDGSRTRFKKDDIVKFVMNGNQISGNAGMSANQITSFNFNVDLYINGKFEDRGTVNRIWVKGYSDYQSNLTYRLPSYLSGTELQADGETLIDWWPENDSAINIYNISLPADSNLIINFNSGNTYFVCSGDYEIVNS
jgi:hypothetical protein